MPTLYMFTGLPAAGKTTEAKRMVALSNGTMVRVNKDDIRTELAVSWSEDLEKDKVIPMRNERIIAALKAGKDVISDDTNLAPKHQRQLLQIARSHGAKFVTHNFEVSLDEAIRRDALREGTARVGADVITKTARRYLPHLAPSTPACKPYAHTPGLPYAVICDIDGTACLHGDRSPYDNSQSLLLDAPNGAVRTTLWALRPDHQLLYVSGRQESDRDITLAFLDTHGFPEAPLHMRATGDMRKDFVVKGELFDAHIRGKFNVMMALDDRDQVVDFWRSIGVTCWQVSAGAF